MKRKRTVDQAEQHKNQLVSELKERLEERYARGDYNDKAMCMTMVAAPAWPKGTGIQPRILSAHKDGGNVYSVTCAQARKFLEKLGETPPPKDIKKR